jgi:hypothetical protein
MLLRKLPHTEAPRPAVRVRDVVAAALHAASAVFAQLAQRLADVEAPAAGEPIVEYHAEAGAPEGALYVNGLLVGHLEGVRRL